MNTNLRKQIRETYEKVLQDHITQSLLTKKYKDIYRYIQEIHLRLNRISSKEMKVELDKTIDLDLVKQMLENNAFDQKDFIRISLIYNERLTKLQAPVDDHLSREFESQINDFEGGKIPFIQVVPQTILQFNKRIDKIEEDMRAFLKDGRAVLQQGIDEAKKDGTLYK
jgi:hypothetical protein